MELFISLFPKLFFLFFSVGVVGLIFVSPSLMSRGLVKMSIDANMNFMEYVICSIPIVNVFYGWKQYSNSRVSLTGIAYLTLLLTILVRVACMYLIPLDSSLQYVTTIGALVLMLICWILCSIDLFIIMNESGCYKKPFIILCALSLIVGQVVVGVYMPKTTKYYLDKEKNKDLYAQY